MVAPYRADKGAVQQNHHCFCTVDPERERKRDSIASVIANISSNIAYATARGASVVVASSDGFNSLKLLQLHQAQTALSLVCDYSRSSELATTIETYFVHVQRISADSDSDRCRLHVSTFFA